MIAKDSETAVEKQPTPRKGTETGLYEVSDFGEVKQPTPRKGTETKSASITSTDPMRNNPHPVRGRKRLSLYYNFSACV